jgi:ubiquinone/menaquinone biosynthesis C-methylase UbiE
MRRGWAIPFFGKLTFNMWSSDASRKYGWFKDHLPEKAELIEIGSGPGSLLKLLRAEGYQTNALDITDTAYSDELIPVLYDGDHMPFDDGHFDVAILATMLHHTPDPDHILTEAKRIAKRLVIIEDVYDGPIMEWVTKRADSLMNLEFIGHPHTNRTDDAWKDTFKEMSLKLVHHDINRVSGLFQQVTYVLEEA